MFILLIVLIAAPFVGFLNEEPKPVPPPTVIAQGETP